MVKEINIMVSWERSFMVQPPLELDPRHETWGQQVAREAEIRGLHDKVVFHEGVGLDLVKIRACRQAADVV
jgi:hypothetical protein